MASNTPPKDTDSGQIGGLDAVIERRIRESLQPDPDPKPECSCSTEDSSQTTINYDVFVSNPVENAESRPSWPGPDRRKWTQTTLLPWGTPSKR